jgi:hypothetical protein
LITWLSRFNKPWLHFIILGVVFLKLQGAIFSEPKTVIGPLHESRVKVLQQQWFTRFGRQPSAAQKEKMIADELDRDLLFQHALELELHLHDKIVYDQLLRNMRFLNMAEGKNNDELFQQAMDMQLHQGDEVVKRRLIKKVQERLLIENPPVASTEAQLRAAFADSREQFRLPVRFSILQLFFNREREAEVESVIATIQQQHLNAKTSRHLSSPFMSGYEFLGQTPKQLARHFGAQFVSELVKAGPVAGQWVGPIRSVYGLHYVWVMAIEPGREAQFEQVEPQVRRDLEAKARRQALQNAIAALRNDYEVRL